MERINHRESREQKKSESENKSISKEQKNKNDADWDFVTLIYSNLNFLGFHFAGFQFLKTLCATILPQNSKYQFIKTFS